MSTRKYGRIYKYQLPVDRGVMVHMPHGAEILSVGEQDDGLVVWAIVDSATDAIMGSYLFNVVGTGGTPPLAGRHLGTVQLRSGFVWHVFVTEPTP